MTGIIPATHSFRARLIARLLPILAITITLDVMFNAYFINTQTLKELEARIDLLGTDIQRAHRLAASIRLKDLWKIEEISNAMLLIPDVSYFGIRGSDGVMIYEDSQPVEVQSEVITREFPLNYYSSNSADSQDLQTLQHGQIPQGTLILGYNPSFIKQWSRLSIISTLVTGILLLVLSIFGVDFAYRLSIGAPLKNLARAMQKATDADSKGFSDDEIGLVVNEYNQLVVQQNFLLNAAQRLSNSGSWRLDPKTRDMVWSQQLYEIFGVDPDDIEPSLDSTLQFIHTDDRPLVETSCHPESAGGNDFGREVRIIRRDGKERIVYFQTHCLRNKKGELKSLVGNLTDITERKIKDSERQQDMKLHSLGSLASGMAHSLNNLILPILISSRMALRGLRDDQATRDRLARVVNASEKASALVSRVLDFSRQKEPSFVQFNLSDVLRDGLRLIQVTAPSSIRIDSELSNQPMMISGQPSQLETIVLDLASNAFDSMRGTNGRLLIRLAGKTVEREITGFPNSVLPGHYAYLQIKDSGTGMDKETLQKAFDPFFTTKPDGFGTGLGLANVEGIISTHQGFIQVDSSAGKGTTFHLYFPLIDSGDE